MINIYESNISKYKESAIDAINSGWISNHGKYVNLSTLKIAEKLRSKYAILMANGTCATHCLFIALKYKFPSIKKIYIPNNCYVAAWNSVLMEYDKSILNVMKMDVDTFNICIDEDYIKSLEKNAAILIVHNLGNIVNVPRLKKIRPDLIFVEDNCEGLFGQYANIYSGMSESSLCSSCSFYGNKILTSGEGGCFFTQYEDVYNYIKSVYSQGLSTTRYLHNVHAYNYRMTNIEAAFLYDQLNDISTILEIKYKIFQKYESLLKELIDMDKIRIYKKEIDTNFSPWIFSIRLVGNDKTISETNSFFNDNNVDIRPFFYPINYHEHYNTIQNDDINSYILNKQVIMIPSSPTITITEQELVVNTIYKYIFYMNNYTVIQIDESNKQYIYDNFLKEINDPYFRYYNTRTINTIANHLLTLVLFDHANNKYVGYSHIDVENNINWLGIYIDKKYTNKKYTNKKLGSLLLNFILKQTIVQKLKINLSVDLDNAVAIKLYKKTGFTVVNTLSKSYIMEK